MRVVTWTDDNGYMHRSIIRDCDPDDKAAEIGAPSDTPDLDRLDWAAIAAQFPQLDVPEFKRKLHNRLVQTGLITWTDVQRSQSGITQVLMAVGRDRQLLAALKKPLIMLYKTSGRPG